MNSCELPHRCYLHLFTLPLYHRFSASACKPFALLHQIVFLRPQISHLKDILHPIEIRPSLYADLIQDTALVVFIYVPHLHELVLERPAESIQRLFIDQAPPVHRLVFIHRVDDFIFRLIAGRGLDAFMGIIHTEAGQGAFCHILRTGVPVLPRKSASSPETRSSPNKRKEHLRFADAPCLERRQQPILPGC